MNRIYTKPIVFLAFLLVQASSFAQTVNVQVNVDIDNLHSDTKSILVICELSDGDNTFQGYKKLSVVNKQTADLVEVSVVLEKELGQNALVKCQLKMCQSGSSAEACKAPLGISKAEKNEQYRTFDEGANNLFSSTQRINGLLIPRLFTLPTDVSSLSSGVSTTSAINTESTTISSGIEVSQGSFESTVISVGTDVIVESDAFNPVNIDVGEMTGTGTRFEPVTIDVGQMTGTGTRFQPVTIDVGQMMGVGTRFQPVTINVGQMTGTGTGYEVKITLTKAGDAKGMIIATRGAFAIDAICRADCATATSESIEPGTLLTLYASEENEADWIIEDDRSVFTGWTGDAICAENANGKQTQFALNQSVNCIATFVLVPPELINITVSKKFEGETSAKGLIEIRRTHASGQEIYGLSSEEKYLLECKEGCTGKTSNSFPANAPITLTAFSDLYFHNFDGWSGDSQCPSSGNDYQQIISPNQNLNCTANFSLKPVTGYTLNIDKIGSGTGTVSAFIKRSDVIGCDAACQSAVDPVSSTNPDYWDILNARMNSVPTFTLIFCDSNCSSAIVNDLSSPVIAEYGLTNGVTVFISTRADDGSEFAGFTGDCSNMADGDATQVLITKDSYCAARFNKETGSINNEPQLIMDSLEPIIEFEVERNIDPGTLSINPDFQLNQ